MSQYGLASIPYENRIARSAYLDELPMLAECLAFDHFMEEMIVVVRSIAQYSFLVNKLDEVMPKIISTLTRNQALDFLYKIGERLCISAEDKAKQSFLVVAEQILQNFNDVEHEFTEFLSKEFQKESISKFALWRLARLTQIVQDYSAYENYFCTFFAPNSPTFTDAAEILIVMHRNLAEKYIKSVLMSGNEQARMFAINAIEQHNIDTSDQFYTLAFGNEESNIVLQRIVRLPSKFLTEPILAKLLDHKDVGTIAASAALESPYFSALLPKLIQRGGSGCELNRVNFNVLRACDPIPYDFLALLVKESKEILKDEVINNICSLNHDKVLVKMIFPRMNERGTWRARFNAIQIFKKFLETHNIWESDLSADFSGFVVSMGLDQVYSVRCAAFEALNLFPPGDAFDLVIISFFSLVTMTDKFHIQQLQHLLKVSRASLVKNFDHEQIRNVMKAISYDDPNYFDLSK